MRAAALLALEEKRSYVDGAGLFWILPRRRSQNLLHLLVDFQILANFLDHASEYGAAARGASGGTLMVAFGDAVDLDADTAGRDYYVDHPWCDDRGYLAALVSACRIGCASLPGYRRVRDRLVHEAGLASSLELGHDPLAQRRDGALRQLVSLAHGDQTEATWWELASGAASAMTVIVLLAIAADVRTTENDVVAAVAAYSWVGALSTMLDSYVDRADDLRTGSWSAVDYYGTETAATTRLAYLIDRSLREVGPLRRGHSHVVIVCSMIALFLSRDDARRGELLGAGELTSAGGRLTHHLILPLRAWRSAHQQTGL